MAKLTSIGTQEVRTLKANAAATSTERRPPTMAEPTIQVRVVID